jgi:hypothetical protein
LPAGSSAEAKAKAASSATASSATRHVRISVIRKMGEDERECAMRQESLRDAHVTLYNTVTFHMVPGG